MFYVTMTDRFMSGWGKAQGKLNKVIITCDNYTQATEISDKAKKRPEMNYVRIARNYPSYGHNVLVSNYEYSEIKW